MHTISKNPIQIKATLSVVDALDRYYFWCLWFDVHTKSEKETTMACKKDNKHHQGEIRIKRHIIFIQYFGSGGCTFQIIALGDDGMYKEQ